MKNMKIILALLLVVFMLVQSTGVYAAPSATFITTTPTGYDSADDVAYKTFSQSGKTVIANWGARGEECVFLSKYVDDYYTGNYEWEIMSQLSGGTTQSNAPSSSLYKQLQNLMAGTHTFYTYYDGNKNVRNYYKYTDCVSSDTSKVALLYIGGLVSSTWDSGNTWNQEHVWPKSKLSSDKEIGDIMHLRPANPSENSRRGNTAYGASSGYNPGKSVQGDCARMVLYMYVRWGATGTMWGSSGVIENMNTLLAWMEADPVDTWEMGRNDAVQSVTGVRNVFVDYPEYAWLLFGKEVPANMTTPSGNASNGSSTPNPTTPPATEPTPTQPAVTPTEPSVNPTEPQPTEPQPTEPPIDLPANTDGFKEAVTLATTATTGDSKFNALKEAVTIYNSLSSADKASVAQEYQLLLEAAGAYNQIAQQLNSDKESEHRAIIGATVLSVSVISYAAVQLLSKKYL